MKKKCCLWLEAPGGMIGLELLCNWVLHLVPPGHLELVQLWKMASNPAKLYGFDAGCWRKVKQLTLRFLMLIMYKIVENF